MTRTLLAVLVFSGATASGCHWELNRGGSGTGRGVVAGAELGGASGAGRDSAGQAQEAKSETARPAKEQSSGGGSCH